MTIKNKEGLKNIQIVCREQKDIENCLNMLEELGFEVRNNDNQYKVIFYREYSGMFENDVRLECGVETYFFNKKFIKTLQKFIKEKKEKEKKEKVEDFEVAEDGRIIKINNFESEQNIYTIYGSETRAHNILALDTKIDLGFIYATAEARDRAKFKLEIKTKLKNIAERLNAGRKIDWEREERNKYYIYYNYNIKALDYCSSGRCPNQGTIYCLAKDFLDVAKQEIGEEQLIKYFKE